MEPYSEKRHKEQLSNSHRDTALPILKNMKLFQEINLSSCRKNVNLFVFYFCVVIRIAHVFRCACSPGHQMLASFGRPGEVVFPFQKKPLFFLIVAFLAAGNNIAFGGFPPAGDRYDVIHGEFFGRKRTAAVVTDPLVAFPFPPLGLAHFTCLVTFALDVVFRKIIGVRVHF